jgi:hypothetical protein
VTDASRLAPAILCAFLLGAVTTAAAAQSPSDSAAADTVRLYRNRLIAFPFVSYSSQTKLLLGAGGRYQFKWPTARADSATRPSQLTAGGAYTTKGQWGVSLGASLYLPRNRWWIAGGIGAGFFPATYYGVGPRTRVADGLLLEQHFRAADVRILRRLRGDFSAGVHYRGGSYTRVKWEDTTRIPSGLAGATGGQLSGAGVVGQIDTRNSTTTPTHGHYLLVDLLRYGSWLGSDFSYTSASVDARVYLPVRGARDVIALALYGQWNGAEVPIQAMAMLGGITTQELMRGVYLGRFRDQNQLVAQADYRGHLKGRFGYVVYGSAGNVYGSAGTTLFDRLKFTYGTGLRFDINPSDPINLRVDYTFTSFGSGGLSLGAGEAF